MVSGVNITPMGLMTLWPRLLGVLGHLKDDPEEIVLPHLNTTQLPLGLLVAFVQLVNSLQLGTV